MTHTLILHSDDLDHFRTILREQLAGDRELLRDVQCGREVQSLEPDATERLLLVEGLAHQLGGLY